MKIGRSRTGGGISGSQRQGAVAKAGSAPDKAVRRSPLPRDVVSVFGGSEMALAPEVQEALARLMEEVRSLRSELERAQARIAQLEELSDRDPLVPLVNRRAFVRELSRYLSIAERYGTPSSVIYFDLDGMKAVNDAFTHAAGDALLLHVADILLKQLRSSDVVGRLGGDEFGVILMNADLKTGEAKAAQLAHSILSTPLVWDGRQIAVTVSYGVHCFLTGEPVDEALNAADRAMYARKRSAASQNSVP